MHNQVMLQLFKEQLENQCESLGSQFELDKRGDRLIWWFFREFHSFENSDIEDIHCDGPSDLGIDAVWIDDDDDENVIVHIYSFKHPTSMDSAFKDGDVDKLLSGLAMLIGSSDISTSANPSLQERIAAMKQVIPREYRVHLVTSGSKVGDIGRAKMDNFVDATSKFTWVEDDLESLQRRFYEHNLPAVEDPITFSPPDQPFIIKSGEAVCYFFAVNGESIAGLYDTFGEPILHRNIRTSQGNTATNRAIEATCIGPASLNFMHFNNGVTFIAEEAAWDPISKEMRLKRSQIVNGGQTARVLHGAWKLRQLQDDVMLAVRVIQSGGDRDFASDVTVCQNNQNPTRTGMLRANDPVVVQLANSLASLGWFLERRENELKYANDVEKKRIEEKIGGSLDGKVIPLKAGAQAYVATYFGNPELAKKNSKKIFQSIDDKGQFEKVFSTDMTAEKLVIAFETHRLVDQFVGEFSKAKNKRRRGVQDWNEGYRLLLGDLLVDQHIGLLDQAIPQSAFFLTALIFREWIEDLIRDPSELVPAFKEDRNDRIQRHLLWTFAYAIDNPDSIDTSWPNLLKSASFYKAVRSHTSQENSGS